MVVPIFPLLRMPVLPKLTEAQIAALSVLPPVLPKLTNNVAPPPPNFGFPGATRTGLPTVPSSTKISLPTVTIPKAP